MNKTITTEKGCTHEPLVDTGVGYYHCPACNQGWTYQEWESRTSKTNLMNQTIDCIFCGQSCDPAPTKMGWTQVGNQGLHFDCARKVARQGDDIDKIEKGEQTIEERANERYPNRYPDDKMYSAFIEDLRAAYIAGATEALTQPTEAEGWKAVELLREYRDMLLTPLNKEVSLKEVMKMCEWFNRVEKLLGSLPSNSNQ
jgi:transcription elongation factor Elf1